MAPLDSSAAAMKSAAVASKLAAAGSDGDHSMTGPAAVGALAGALDISQDAAQQALQQIAALSGQGGVDPTAPAFAAIAHRLGISPEALAAALGQVKQAVAGR
jgi:hypothetical protein